MLCTINGARTTELAQLGSDISRAYANGALSEDGYQCLWEAIQERRTETRPKPRAAPSGPPRGSARSLRSIRSRTRRRLHEPRPAVSHETRARRGQWRTRVEAAQLAGEIGKSVHLYLFALLEIPSVMRGDYCIYADAQMARRLNNVHVDTVRDHRKQAEKAGLIEVLGHGRDHKPCLVRPILDGNSVFPTGNCAWPSQVIVPADFLLTKEPKDSPPLSPTVPDAAGEGGRAVDRCEDQSAEPATVPSAAQVSIQDTAQDTNQTREALAQPPVEESAERTKPPEPETASETIQHPCGPASSGRVPFEELWRLNQRGWIGRARTAWLRLSDAQTHAAKADLEAILRRGPLPEGFDYAATHFAMIRRGQPAAPILAPAAAPVRVPERVHIRENTPEWRAWQRHLGRSLPVDNRGGWWVSSRLPPYDEGTPKQGERA
jgi:hypothetical protein